MLTGSELRSLCRSPRSQLSIRPIDCDRFRSGPWYGVVMGQSALTQGLAEIPAGRFDFKNTQCTIEFDRDKATIALHADDEYRMDALLDVVRGRLISPEIGHDGAITIQAQ